MKINFIKQSGGKLIPASDIESSRMQRFKTGDIYEIDIKLERNYKFHGKVFSFLTFCFDFWKASNEYIDDHGQFEIFRKDMIILAGYFNKYYAIDGSVKVEAKSISYKNMEQDEFESLYSALINVALDKIFIGADKKIEERLYGFFS